MSDFVIKYWLQIVFGVITAGLTAAYANVRHKLKRQKIVEQAILALLHDRLYQACQTYITQEYATIEDKRNLEYMFVPYSALGGNGTCKCMYERCQALPYRKES